MKAASASGARTPENRCLSWVRLMNLKESKQEIEEHVDKSTAFGQSELLYVAG